MITEKSTACMHAFSIQDFSITAHDVMNMKLLLNGRQERGKQHILSFYYRLHWEDEHLGSHGEETKMNLKNAEHAINTEPPPPHKSSNMHVFYIPSQSPGRCK